MGAAKRAAGANTKNDIILATQTYFTVAMGSAVVSSVENEGAESLDIKSASELSEEMKVEEARISGSVCSSLSWRAACARRLFGQFLGSGSFKTAVK